jgi:hypothetical protein
MSKTYEEIALMSQEEKEEYMWRYLFNMNMAELLNLKDLNNTLYQENSVYNGGSLRYIPKANWDWVWSEPFLRNMNTL